MPALRLFEKPQETPPGLDAIRAWLRKPRPRLHGAWIWVRWILSGVPEAYRYFRKKWPAAREGIRRIATEGEKVARGAVRIGYAAREIGGGVVRSTRALRGSDGKVSGTTARVRELGRAVRGFGGRLTEGGTGIAAALSTLRQLARPDREESATGLGLLDPPADREPERSEAPERQLPESVEPSRPDRVFEDERPLPAVPRTKTREPPEPSTEPLHPEPPSEPAAPAPSDTDRTTRFNGLPAVFIPQAAAVGERPHPEALRALILEICRHRDWTTPAQLARWFDMHRRGLSNRHLRPLLKAGLLERRYPDRPNTPKQAYRTRRDGRTPQNPAALLPRDAGG